MSGYPLGTEILTERDFELSRVILPRFVRSRKSIPKECVNVSCIMIGISWMSVTAELKLVEFSKPKSQSLNNVEN